MALILQIGSDYHVDDGAFGDDAFNDDAFSKQLDVFVLCSGWIRYHEKLVLSDLCLHFRSMVV